MPLRTNGKFWTGFPWWPVLLALTLHVCTWFPELVEKIYGRSFYPRMGSALRILTGWWSVSFGDLIYIAVIFFLLHRLFLLIRRRRMGRWQSILSVICWVYVWFQLGWGMNYSRLPAEHRIGLKLSSGDTIHLRSLTARLLEKTNAYAVIRRAHLPPPAFDSLVGAARSGYETLSHRGLLPAPGPISVKRSIFGVMGNYLGYSGYFNPFTGEAQLNDAVPAVLHPFVVAHEMGHQLGFAREQEANLTGFLAARASGDSLMRYSAYFDMFLYANAALYRSDSMAARRHYESLAPLARKDLETLRAFRIRYRTVLEELTDWWYDRFLRLNGQEQGARSYGLVVSALLALWTRDNDI